MEAGGSQSTKCRNHTELDNGNNATTHRPCMKFGVSVILPQHSQDLGEILLGSTTIRWRVGNTEFQNNQINLEVTETLVSPLLLY